MDVDFDGWDFDPNEAGSLGFQYLAVGGSRSYARERFGQDADAKQRDWDLIGIVESKNDILSLVLDHAERLSAFLGIVDPEPVKWQALQEANHEEWDVLRFSGYARDSTKRSLKICSHRHLQDMLQRPGGTELGVLSARAVRRSRHRHPSAGSYVFVYQPMRMTESLYVLHDADFLSAPSRPDAMNPGVTLDLFLASSPVFDIRPDLTDRLVETMLHKWTIVSRWKSAFSIIQHLFRYQRFESYFKDHLQAILLRAAESLLEKEGLVLLTGPFVPDQRSETDGQRDFVFAPLKPGFWDEDHSFPIPSPLTKLCETPIDFRPESVLSSNTPFTSNSTGIFGDMRISEHEWRSVFVKMSPHVGQELSALAEIRQYYPRQNLQQLMMFDGAIGRLFYELFRGRLLNQVRLDVYLNKGILGGIDQAKLMDWFLDVELRRAEHITDAYRQTLQKFPDPCKAVGQKIHRFFYNRLQSDQRFLDFYGGAIPSLSSGIMDSASQLLNATLIINGVAHPPLRHYLDRAQELLNPHLVGSQATLASLPIAIGLGDGHGGNVMVVEGKSPAEFIHIDYEVSGFHSPILDMAKPLWLDGFFNVAYADLLESSVTDQMTRSGTSVSWILDEDSIYIDYDVACDEIGRLTTLTKLQYILRPLLDYMEQNAPQKLQLALDVLGSALLACALLTRNYAARPDVFFLSLALGVDLAHDVQRVFSQVFDWDSGLESAADKSLILSGGNGTNGHTDGNEFNFDPSHFTLHDLITLISSSGLEPEEVFLKRADETYLMHKRFSRSKTESSSAIISRIGRVRSLGVKIAPHTCIRESIFAEPRVDHHFAYKDIMENRKADDLLVDAGCCMGSDIRKMIFDGFPPERILGLDIENRFFDLGRMLYNEGQTGPKPTFRHADLIDRKFPQRHPDLRQKFDLVHSANVIHLFNVEEQDTFFRNLVFLAKPGGTIFGRQVGLAADHLASYRQPEGKGYRFTALEFREWCLRIGGWDAEGADGPVFEAQVVQYDEIRLKRADKGWVLQWKVRVPKTG